MTFDGLSVLALLLKYPFLRATCATCALMGVYPSSTRGESQRELVEPVTRPRHLVRQTEFHR